MRHVLLEHYDDARQECTRCPWRGSRFDEPWPHCPRCGQQVTVSDKEGTASLTGGPTAR